MNIYASGISHKTASLEIRERLSFNTYEAAILLKDLQKLKEVDECVVLSTCNRTEVYVYSVNESFDTEQLESGICKVKGLDIYGAKKYFNTYTGLKAVRHLFRVASGLDSLVLGEDQILGQLKNAHELSMHMKTSGSILNTLFRQAVTSAKKVKTRTELSRNSISVSSVAVKFLADIYGGTIKERNALIIGAGKTGTIAVKNLLAEGVGKIYITNRTICRAEGLSKDYANVFCVDYNSRYRAINECDIVISSTSSPHYTITRDVLEKSLIQRRNRVFIDLAVPRDIDSSIKELPGVRYYNIDSLQPVVDKNMGMRMLEAEKAGDILEEYVAEFQKWYEFRRMLPIVKNIQELAENDLNDRIARTMEKLKDASEEDKELVKASFLSTFNGIMKKLLFGVRDCECKEDIEAYFRCINYIMRQ